MSTSNHRQYTRKPRIRHALLGILLAAGGLPAVAAAASAPTSTHEISASEPTFNEFFEFYLELMWEILIRWPPPKLGDPPSQRAASFIEGYHTVGIYTDLGADQRAHFSAAALDLMAHLASDPGQLDPALYNELMSVLAAIVAELGVVGGN